MSLSLLTHTHAHKHVIWTNYKVDLHIISCLQIQILKKGIDKISVGACLMTHKCKSKIEERKKFGQVRKIESFYLSKVMWMLE